MFCVSTFSLCFIDVEEVIDMAKRKLEKERELFMSKSLPGFAADNQENDNESESDEDSDESDEKGTFNKNKINEHEI